MNVNSSERGGLNVLLIPLIMAVLLLFGAIGFGAWAFMGREDYKKNFDTKAAAVSAVAVAQAETKKDNEFLQKEKEPLKSYTSAVQYGTFSIQYPKTWSAYVSEQPGALSMFMQPDIVISSSPSYVVRVDVISTPYDQVITQLDAFVKQGKLTVKAYALPKVPTNIGIRADGQIANNKQGAEVFLPLRDKTIKITTESLDHIADFNNIILPNFEFSP
jgi:hypothetical protein